MKKIKNTFDKEEMNDLLLWLLNVRKYIKAAHEKETTTAISTK